MIRHFSLVVGTFALVSAASCGSARIDIGAMTAGGSARAGGAAGGVMAAAGGGSSSGGSASAGGGSSSIDAGAFIERGAIPANASISTLGLAGNTGRTYRFVCPALGNADQPELWGTTVYTDDSPICWAAMQCERITRAMGGEVFVQVLPGTSSYLGAYRAGVVSTGYGPYTGSFTIIRAPTGPLVPYDGGSIWTGIPASPQGAIDWEENPQANRGAWGVRFQYACPSISPSLALGSIWGSSPYTDDSRICVAAAHVGVITRSGGLVTIETVPGISVYPSTNRNGIVSNRFGAYPGSFLVVP